MNKNYKKGDSNYIIFIYLSIGLELIYIKVVTTQIVIIGTPV